MIHNAQRDTKVNYALNVYKMETLIMQEMASIHARSV